MKRFVHFALVATATVGCDAPAGSVGGDAVVRDSAGIQVVEHPADPGLVAPPLTLSDPLFAHGSRPGDHLFDRIVDGAILPDGSIVIADIGSSEIVGIAPDGSAPVVLAGSGQGPGEVRFPIGVHALGGDSVLVEDDGNGKFLVLRGRDVAQVVSVAGDPQLARGLRAHAMDGSGNLLMTTSSYMSDAGTGWIPGAMVRFDPADRAADTVATFDMAFSRPRDGPQNPFAPFGHVSASSAGFVVGRSDRPELLWRHPDGTPARIVRWNPTRVFPDESDLERVEARLREDLPRVNPGMPASRLEEFIQEQIAQLQVVPDEPLPLFVELMDHGDAGVWLRAYEPAGDFFGGGSGYRVVSPDGRSIRSLSFSTPTRVLDVAFGRLLGVFQDDLDVQHVVVYAFEGRP
ncbi:MAG: hypothetical protein RJQ04_13685 [Longimicrobiales bacterium]